MSNWMPGRYVPTSVPGADLTPDDMAAVTPDDWADIRKRARAYCRTVDATRSRKRMDGSATVVRNGQPVLGTDDVSDDVTQDAVLIFAQRLRDITKQCPVASVWTDTREPASWIYTRKDGETRNISRATIIRWAIGAAASRNGYRADIPADEIEETPGAQVMRGARRGAESVTRDVMVRPYLAQQAQAIWRRAFGDGSEFPIVRDIVFNAGSAEDLGRANILGTVAQAHFGGVLNSSSKVQRTRDIGSREWQELSSRLDEAREELVHKGAVSGE